MSKRSSYFLVCALALGACKKAEVEEKKPEAERIHVETVPAGKKQVPKEITLTGVLAANERTDLAANASGRVIKVFVELGQRVSANAPIAQLDRRIATLAAREADANVKTQSDQLAAYKKDCERYEGLLKKGAITQQEYDRTMGQCQTQGSSEIAARVKVEQAAQSLADSTIRAPFGGKVADRNINVGDYVQPSSKVITLLSDNPLRLRLTVPESSIAAIKLGLEVRFETASVPGREFKGNLKFIGGEVREQTRDLIVEALVDNKDGALLPGMFVTAHLGIGMDDLPVVPKQAMVAGTSPSVFIVDGDRARQRILQLGPQVGEEMSVIDGIKAGDKVVLNPSNKLADGALVN